MERLYAGKNLTEKCKLNSPPVGGKTAPTPSPPATTPLRCPRNCAPDLLRPLPWIEHPQDRQNLLRFTFSFCDKGTCGVFLLYAVFWLHIYF